MDSDPLSSYENYNAPYQPPFHPEPNIPPTEPNNPYTFPNKDYYPPSLPYNQNESCNAAQDGRPNDTEGLSKSQNTLTDTQNVTNNDQNTATDQTNTNVEEEQDIKPDISKIKIKRVKKLKGRTSNYWNKKVTDKDFKFYGCSVCNISFQDLKELDAHVTVHSNRVTSYDIRIQNLKKRKQIKKDKKKKKKDSKVKSEFELEIKPEDGYVGTEKAAVFNGQTDVKNEDVTKGELVDVKNDVKSDNGDEKMDKEMGNKKDEVYKCFACNKKFALSYYLKIHVRSHTGKNNLLFLHVFI